MDKHHPPGTGPRPASVPAVPETSSEAPKDIWAWADSVRANLASASYLYIRARIYNHLARLGRPGAFLEIHHVLSIHTREHLEAAIDDLEARGLLIRVESPSPANPLLDPPIVRWRVFGKGDPFPEGAAEFVNQCGAIVAQIEGGADQ